MKRTILLALCASFGLFSAAVESGAKGPPVGGNFSVTIESTLSDLVTPTTIQSDGSGAYTNGVDGVEVNATFINFWSRADRGARQVNFNEAVKSSIPGGTGAEIRPSGLTSNDTNGLHDPHMGGPYLPTAMKDMNVGASQCGTLFWAAFDGETGYAWRLANFRVVDPVVSHVVVTRNSASQWTVESNHASPLLPLCEDAHYDNLAMVLHDVTTTVGKKTVTTTYNDGYYYVPFRLRYTLQ